MNEHSIVIKADTTAVDNMSRSLASLATNGKEVEGVVKSLTGILTSFAGSQDKVTESTKRKTTAASEEVSAAAKQQEASQKLVLTFESQKNALIAVRVAMDADAAVASSSAVQRRLYNSVLASGVKIIEDEKIVIAKQIESLKQENATLTATTIARIGLTKAEIESHTAKAQHAIEVKKVTDAVKAEYVASQQSNAAADAHVAAYNKQIAASRGYQEQLGKEIIQLQKRELSGTGLSAGNKTLFAPIGQDPNVIRAYNSALNDMANTSDKAVTSTGLLSKYSHQFGRTLFDLTPIISGLGLLTLAHGAIQATDQYTKLTSQLKIATNSTSEYAFAMSEVKRISSAAQVDIGAIGSLYQRLSLATQASGTSQKEVALITETVSLGLKANGASARESASAMLQLSQSFGSGRMAGEEFNSMAEAAPNVLRALATSMGVPYGALKQLASEGKITTEVMVKAFTDPALLASFQAQAKSMRTITGSWVELTNALVLYVGESSKSSGVVSVLSGVLSGLANHLKLAADAAIALALVVSVDFAAAFIKKRLLIIESTNALIASTAATKIATLVEVEHAKANLVQAANTALLTGERSVATAALARYTVATAAATVATEAHAAASVGMLGKLSSFLGVSKLGIIGLALWGAYEIADYMGWIDQIFNKTKVEMENLNKLAGQDAGLKGAIGRAIEYVKKQQDAIAAQKAQREEYSKMGIAFSTDADTFGKAVDSRIKQLEMMTKAGAAMGGDVPQMKEWLDVLRQVKVEMAKPVDFDFASNAGKSFEELNSLFDKDVIAQNKHGDEVKKINKATWEAQISYGIAYYQAMEKMALISAARIADINKPKPLGSTSVQGSHVPMINWSAMYAGAEEEANNALKGIENIAKAYDKWVSDIDGKQKTKANTAADNTAKELAASQSKIAVMEAEMSGTVKLTDSQKKLIELGYEYVNGVGKMTAATYAKSAANLADVAVTELQKVATDDATKAAEEQQKILEDSGAAFYKEIEAIDKKIAASKWETETIGMTKEQIDLLKQSRELGTVSIYEEELALKTKRGADEIELARIRMKIDRLKELAAQEGKAAPAQAADAAAKEWQKASDHISRSLSDALWNSFNNGANFGKAMVESMKSLFKTTVFEPEMKAIVTAGTDWVKAMLANTIATETNTAVQAGTKGSTTTVPVGGGTAIAYVAAIAIAAYAIVTIIKGLMRQSEPASGISGTVTSQGVSGQNYTIDPYGATTLKEFTLMQQYLLKTTFDSIKLNVVQFADKLGLGTQALEKFAMTFNIIGGSFATLTQQMTDQMAYATLGIDYAAMRATAITQLLQAANVGATDQTGYATASQLAPYQIDQATEALIQSALPAWFVELQHAGESVGATLMRVIKIINTVDGMWQMLGFDIIKSFGAIGSGLAGISASSILAREALIAAMGGMDKFTATMSQFYNDFYTEAERLANAQTSIIAGFDSLKLAVPASNEEFRNLVAGLDLTTAAGLSTFTALMAIAPAFAQVQRAAAKLVNDQLSLQARIAELTGDKAAAEAILAQQREIELAKLDPALRALTKELWALEDAAKAAAEAAKLLDDKLSLQAQYYALIGDKAMSADILAQQRAIELAKLDPSLRGLQTTIWKLQDAAKIIEEMNKTLAQMDAVKAFSRGITDAINSIKAEQGDFASGIATSVSRVVEARDKLKNAVGVEEQLAAAGELKDAIMARYAAESAEIKRVQGLIDALGQTIKGIASSIHEIESQKKGFNNVAYTVQNVVSAGAELAGATTTEDKIAASKKLESAIMARYAAGMNDIQARRDAENKAGQEAIDAANKFGQESVDAFNKLNQAMKGFADYAKSLLIGDKSALTIQSKLLETQSQYNDLLAKTKGGDADAAGKIQGVADTLLQQRKDTSVSAIEYARSFAKVQADFLALGAGAGTDKTFSPQVYAENTAKWETEQLKLQNESIAQLEELRLLNEAWLLELQTQLPSLQELQQNTINELIALNALTAGWQVMLEAQLKEQLTAFNALGLTAREIVGLLTGLPSSLAAIIKNSQPSDIRIYLPPNLTGGGAPNTGKMVASAISPIPAFADGVNVVPFDMTARIHAGEEIKPKQYVDKHKAANDETREINSDMRSELAAIRQELVAIKSTNYKMWQIEDKHDIEGVPSERLVA